MTSPMDEAPSPTPIPSTSSSEVTGAQPDAPGRGSIGLMATLLVHLTGLRTHAFLTSRPSQWSEAEGGRVGSPVNPAPATDVPSRRALLAMLLGTSVARSLSHSATAAAGSITGEDAGLIALAARTEVLADAFRTAIAMLVAADNAMDEFEVRQPNPRSRGGAQHGAGPAAAEEVLDHGQVIHGARRTTEVEFQVVQSEHDVDVANRRRTRVAASPISRRRAALRKYDRITRHLAEAVAAITGLQAVSGAGNLAKASACAAVFNAFGGCEPPDWLSEFIRTTLRDVIVTGGAV